MNISDEKIINKHNKDTFLQSSNDVMLTYPLFILPELNRNLVLPEFGFLIVILVTVISFVILMLDAEIAEDDPRGIKRGPQDPTLMDTANNIRANLKRNPGIAPVSEKLANQHLDNHPKLPQHRKVHNAFSPDRPDVYMDPYLVARFVAIVNELPHRIIPEYYTVRNGVVWNIKSNRPAIADTYILYSVYLHEMNYRPRG